MKNPDEAYFIIVGKEVLLVRNEQEILSLLRRPGQLLMCFLVEEDIVEEIKELLKAA
ncbi:MAG: hypothetical protein ACM3SR_06410 [Ignavibacteriales bacterium]